MIKKPYLISSVIIFLYRNCDCLYLIGYIFFLKHLMILLFVNQSPHPQQANKNYWFILLRILSLWIGVSIVVIYNKM